MKLLSIFLILSLVLCPVIGADTVFSGPVGLKNLSVSSGGDTTSYDDIIFYHNCDALGDATKAAGSATMTIEGGISIGTGVISGSFLDADGTNKFSFVMADNITLTSGRFGFYWKPTNNSGADSGHYFYTTGGDDREFSFYQTTTSGISRLSYDTTSVNSFAPGLTAGTWYWVEIEMTGTSAKIYIDNVLKYTKENATPSFSDTVMTFLDKAGYGHMGGEYDQIMCSNDVDRVLYLIKDETDIN